MNKRLHQIANEVRVEVSQRIGYNDRDRDIAFVQEFGKAIVRACVQFIEEENVRLCEYQTSLPEWEGNKRDDCDLVIQKCIDLSEGLNQQFGVEE